MEQRIQKLKQLLLEQNLDAALISSVPNIYFLTGYGGFSTEERDAFLIITKKKAYLLTNALYIDAVREQVNHFEIIEVSREKRLDKILQEIITKDTVASCGLEEENITLAEFKPIQKLKIQFSPMTLDSLRAVKSSDEIKLIQGACAVGDKAYAYIKKQLHEGVTELEIAHKLELFIKKQGHDISFRAIVAFGKNAAVPHHFSSTTTLQKNDGVLFDFGVKYQKYCSDMTRTLFFGQPKPVHKKVYQTVLQAQQLAAQTLADRLKKEGSGKIFMRDIDAVAREYIMDKGYPSIPHTLGHSIGLEVHDGFRLYKTSHEKFENGMVFSIEPGIYLPNTVGVRIEDLYAIQNNKLIQLTKSKSNLLVL